MTEPSEAMLEQAIAWHLRLAQADEEAWLRFTDWLEADPAHNAAYEAVLEREAEWSGVLPQASFGEPLREDVSTEHGLVQDNEPEPAAERPRRGWVWGGWGAAAASVAMAGWLAVQAIPGRDTYAVETGPGQHRSLALADGGRVVLNGSTRVVLDRDDPRRAELAFGEARFEVIHNPRAPFTVEMGKTRLVDIGTVFNVLRNDRLTRVGVAEGAVHYDGSARDMDLQKGDVLVVSGGSATLHRRPPEAIGSWVDRMLVYDHAALDEVAADLSRNLGISVSVSPALGSRRFSGVIQTDGQRDTVKARLGEVLGVTVEGRGESWTLRE